MRAIKVNQFSSYLYGNKFLYRYFESMQNMDRVSQEIFCPHNIFPLKGDYDKSLRIHHRDSRGWPLSSKIVLSKKFSEYITFVENHLSSADVYHAHSLYADGLVTAKLAKKNATPYMITVRGCDVDEFPKFYPHWRSKIQDALLSANYVVFVNHQYRDRLENIIKIKLDPKRCCVIPNGAEDLWHRADVVQKKPSLVRNFLCIGKLIPRKNQLNLIKAISNIRACSNAEINIDFIGECEGGYGKKVLKMCEDNVWANYVGSCTPEEIITKCENIDGMLLASHHENFGIVYAEALALGIPILYTRNQGFDGWFENERFGVSVDSRSIHSIADGIAQLLTLDISAIEAKKFSQGLFNWRSIAESYSELYFSCCS